MASQSKTAVNVVFGAMTIGKGDEQSLVSDLDEAKQILDIFQSRGAQRGRYRALLWWCASEETLGQLHWHDRGIVMDTKYYPTVGRGMDKDQWTHKP